MPTILHQRDEVWLRHIKRGSGFEPAAEPVLGLWFYPDNVKGINGDNGWVSGWYEDAKNDDAGFSITLPNGVGADGIRHSQRFSLLSDPQYKAGDEWIEIWRGHPGVPVFVGTPTKWTRNKGAITIEGYCPSRVLKKWRASHSDVWSHSLHDAFEHYTRGELALLASDFDGASLPPEWTAQYPAQVSVSNSEMVMSSVSPNTTLDVWTSDLYPTFTRSSGDSTFGFKIEAVIYIGNIAANGIIRLFPNAGQPDETKQIRFTLSRDVPAAGQTTFTILAPRPTSTSLLTELPQASVTVPSSSLVTMVLEIFQGWCYATVNGQTIGIVPWAQDTNGNNERVGVGIRYNGANGSSIAVRSVLVTGRQPFLLSAVPSGAFDYRVPGAPPAGGLQGYYFDEGETRSLAVSASSNGNDAPNWAPYFMNLLNPGKQPYATRIDSQLNFNIAAPMSFQPIGPALGERWSARWLGAVYLDFDAHTDYRFRITADDAARMWIGRTTWGWQYIDDWTVPHSAFTSTGAFLTTHLGSTLDSSVKTGWYPVKVEYHQYTSGGQLTLEYETNASGVWTAVPASMLSPYGCFSNDVGSESAREMLDQVSLSAGFQWKCEPIAIGASGGGFPGRIWPQIRVGRDTEYIIEEDVALNLQSTGDAEDGIDRLVADAAGIADPSNVTQVTASTTNFAGAQQHLLLNTDYTSLSDISEEALLKQRIDSLMSLRLGPWEQLSAQPHMERKAVDSFPLSDTLAEWDTKAGDGARLNWPSVGTVDVAPRQIERVKWPIRPAGRARPEVAFRQRPRAIKDLLKQIYRAALTPQRSYQGQLAIVDGSVGQIGSAGGGTDQYSRISYPSDISKLAKAYLIVGYYPVTGTVVAGIQINGVNTGVTLDKAGRYDITPFMTRPGTPGSSEGPRAYATLTNVTGTPVAQFWLQLVVSV